jgi:hypothetical protein
MTAKNWRHARRKSLIHAAFSSLFIFCSLLLTQLFIVAYNRHHAAYYLSLYLEWTGRGRGAEHLRWRYRRDVPLGADNTRKRPVWNVSKKSRSRFSRLRKILSPSEIIAHMGPYCDFSAAASARGLANQFFHTFLSRSFPVPRPTRTGYLLSVERLLVPCASCAKSAALWHRRIP